MESYTKEILKKALRGGSAGERLAIRGEAA
jgi:hypothetical protein